MEKIIKRLKQEIINNDLVKNSSLFNLAHWKIGHYNILSEIISENLSKSKLMQGSKKNDLGTSISGSTLKRIFSDSFTVKGSTDLRFLKSLDKLAIFLGYQNLNNYILDQSKSEKSQPNSEKGIEIQEIESTDIPFSFFTDMITNYCLEEFEAFKKLPTFSTGKMVDYGFEDGPLYKRGFGFLSKCLELNLHLDYENNRSNFEIYGFKLREISEDKAVVSTKEFWNLYWLKNDGSTFHRNNMATSQLYFFKKKDGVWKIWDNHNPGYDSLIKTL